METIKDFLDACPTRTQEECQKSLKDYLITVWHLLKVKRDENLTPKLISDILETSCISETPPFEDIWLESYLLPDEPSPDDHNGFGYFKDVIFFQIADLHQIEKAGMLKLSREILFGGIQSPSGSSWYNFSIFDFVECGSAGLADTSSPEFLERTKLNWVDVANLLEFGQMYE